MKFSHNYRDFIRGFIQTTRRTMPAMLVVVYLLTWSTLPVIGQDIPPTDESLSNEIEKLNQEGKAEYVANKEAIVQRQEVPADDESLEQTLSKLMNDAIASRTAFNFERIENIRLERSSLITRYFQKNPESKSPWVAGVKALEFVDGVSAALKAASPNSATKIGLVEEARYKEAFETLCDAWILFDKKEFRFGDLAIRAVEVVHQAGGILGLENVTDPNSEFFIADNPTLQTMLIDAFQSDPTAIMAACYGQWLGTPDISETYLRAELRKRFYNRQLFSLRLSHELSLVPPNQRFDPKIRNQPVLPHHAPIEFLKARSLSWLTQDLSDTALLAPDFYTKDYRLPGVIINCKDAANTDIQILYGSRLLCKSTDATGKTRTAFLFYDNFKNNWSKRYLSILYLVPEDVSTLDKDERLIHNLLANLPLEKELELNQRTVRQYAYPTDATAELLRTSTKILRVDDINKLTDTSFQFSNNNSSELYDRLTSYLRNPKSGPSSYSQDPIKISPTVGTAVHAIKLAADATVHPLIELLSIDAERFNKKNSLIKPYESFEALQKADPAFAEKLQNDKRLQLLFTKQQEEKRGFAEDETLVKTLEAAKKSPNENENEKKKDYRPLFNPLLVVSDADDSPAEPLWFIGELDENGQPALYIQSEEFGKVYFKKDPVDFEKSWFEFKIRGSKVIYPLTYSAVPGIVLVATDAGQKLLDALRNSGFDQATSVKELAKIFKTQVLPDRLKQFIAAKQRSALGVDVQKEFLIDLQLQTKYGFRYMVDPRGNVLLNTGISEEDSNAGKLFSYIGVDGLEIPDEQHYSAADYERLNRNAYLEHLSKATTFFPCTRSWQLFHNERTKKLFNPSGKIPEYLEGWGFEDGARQPMFKIDGMDYGNNEAWNAVPKETVRYESVAPGQFLAASLVKSFLNKEAGSEELKGLNRLAAFYSALWEVPATSGPGDGSAYYLDKDLENFKQSCAGKNKNRRDLLTTLLRHSAREYARWEDLHAAIVLYNDLLKINFDEVEQWDDGDEWLGEKSPINVNNIIKRVQAGNIMFAGSTSLLDASVRNVFDEDGNIFELVPDTQTGVELTRAIKATISSRASKVKLLLELAGVLSQTNYATTSDRIWDEIVASKVIYLDPFIQETKNYFNAYGLRLGTQVEDAIQVYGQHVQFAEQRRRSRKVRNGMPNSVPSEANRAIELYKIIDKFLSIEEGDIRSDDKEVLVAYQKLKVELHESMKEVSFLSWLKAKKKSFERPEALIDRSYEFSPLLFLPQQYTEKGFIDQPFEELFNEVINEVENNEAKYIQGGWAPDTEVEVKAASLMGWQQLEATNYAFARRCYTLATEGYFHIASAEENPQLSLIHTLNAYRQLAGREAVIYRSPGCVNAAVTFFTGVDGSLLMWRRRWYAAGHDYQHAVNTTEFIINLFEDIEIATAAQTNNDDENRLFFADYRSFLGGAIPEPILYKALDSAWFREIQTARERVRELENASKNKKKNDGKQPDNPADKPDPLEEARQNADTLFGKMFESIINMEQLDFDKEVAELGLTP